MTRTGQEIGAASTPAAESFAQEVSAGCCTTSRDLAEHAILHTVHDPRADLPRVRDP